MQTNLVYEALLDGRFRPEISVSKNENGKYDAVYTSHDGQTVTKSHEDQSEAFRQCQYEVMQQVFDGRIHPYR